jgi:hypothetical protein
MVTYTLIWRMGIAAILGVAVMIALLRAGVV